MSPRDPINGVHMLEFLAGIYAWSDEPELACAQLEVARKLPGGLSYGQLRLSPLWDDLRGYPRFEKIVASLAPGEASNGSSICRFHFGRAGAESSPWLT